MSNPMTPRRDRSEEQARQQRRATGDESGPSTTETPSSAPSIPPERAPITRQQSASAIERSSDGERKKATGLASLMVGALIHEGVLDIDVTDPNQMQEYQNALRTLAGIIVALELVPDDDRPLFDL